jgi:hypothetical protein
VVGLEVEFVIGAEERSDVDLVLAALVLRRDLHHRDEAIPAPPAGLDRPTPPLLRRRAPEEEHEVLLLLVERERLEVEAVVDDARVAEFLVHPPLRITDRDVPGGIARLAVERADPVGERPVDRVDRGDARCDRTREPGERRVHVEDVELARPTDRVEGVRRVDRDVVDRRRPRCLRERRIELGLRHRITAREERHLVPRFDEPIGEERHDPLDPAVALRRHGQPRGADLGDAHGAPSVGGRLSYPRASPVDSPARDVAQLGSAQRSGR